MEILEWIKDFFNSYFAASLMQVAIALGIFLIFVILSSIITKIIYKMASIITRKTKNKVDDYILDEFRRPIKVLVITIGFYIALIYLPFQESTEIIITRLFRISIIIIITWGLYNIAGTYEWIYDKLGDRLNIKSQKILKPFITRIIRIIIISLSFAIILDQFGYNISALIAGLGIGGIAVAMAAKDSLANIFGGMSILMDKPFDIGDWVVFSGVEGLVEDINFRSTKIRTFEKAMITVPNAKVSEEAITNYSRRGIRRVRFYLGLTYSTSSYKIEKVVDNIKYMLIQNPKVDSENITTSFEIFNNSSLDILIQYFANAIEYDEYLDIKQDINLKIMDILEEEKVEIAFPSTSVYFEDNLNLNEFRKES
ncbi:mechanosensitive ion channel family protein [Senegalia sp. (in: firmicutes)]|uniref:mechanosensitive ion channel family protein n=1 Tax=Senegalia sp. (in: firmicutes) TaxID=1924098 RepID=UPI003F9A0E78